MTLYEHELKNAYIGKPRTFTISWEEKSDMSSGWTYSDDAAGLTAGSGDFDDFFGYSAVLLNTSGVETAEIKQKGGVFNSAITNLGNITSGDNVMIKFPVRGIKMSKSGSVVTLSITKELNKDGYQYYAHSTGTLSSPGTPKDKFYIGAYEGYNNSSVLKSWSGKTPTRNVTQSNFCTYAKANGSGYNIIGFYQRQFINALYIMKYGNPNCKSTIGMGYIGGSGVVSTGGTNSQTSASYGTSSTTVQARLFGLEDRWGNVDEWVGGAYTNSSKQLYTMLSGWSGAVSGGEGTGTTVTATSGNCISSIAGNNKSMFSPIGTVNNENYNTYYSVYTNILASRLLRCGGTYNYTNIAGVFFFDIYFNTNDSRDYIGSRLMYL